MAEVIFKPSAPERIETLQNRLINLYNDRQKAILMQETALFKENKAYWIFEQDYTEERIRATQQELKKELEATN